MTCLESILICYVLPKFYPLNRFIFVHLDNILLNVKYQLFKSCILVTLNQVIIKDE
jgi:hypothetical protein